MKRYNPVANVTLPYMGKEEIMTVTVHPILQLDSSGEWVRYEDIKSTILSAYLQGYKHATENKEKEKVMSWGGKL